LFQGTILSWWNEDCLNHNTWNYNKVLVNVILDCAGAGFNLTWKRYVSLQNIFVELLFAYRSISVYSQGRSSSFRLVTASICEGFWCTSITYTVGRIFIIVVIIKEFWPE
jgi:hypothetical protein